VFDRRGANITTSSLIRFEVTIDLPSSPYYKP
jgi:hypothetical protein